MVDTLPFLWMAEAAARCASALTDRSGCHRGQGTGSGVNRSADRVDSLSSLSSSLLSIVIVS